MRLIEIEALSNGAHRNQDGCNTVPEGWAMIPDGMEIPNSFPFVNIEVNGQIVTALTTNEDAYDVMQTEKTEEIRLAKQIELSTACNDAITSGIDVATTQGVEHFSLQETDQINLTTAFNAVNQGMASYPYHSDGRLCRMFTADEIIAISNASVQHKLYHTTLCNHLLTWARRADTQAELESITYSAEDLPEDLKQNMDTILSVGTNL